MVSHLWGILLEPKNTWEALAEKQRAWFPLLIVIAVNALSLFLYYSSVDISWLQQQMLAARADISAEQAQAAADFMTKNAMMWGSIIGAAVVVPIITAVVAVYYLLVSKVMTIDFSYSKWFGFAAWSTVPVVISLLMSILLILMSSDAQISMSVLQPLSLNHLWLDLPLGDKRHTLMNSLSLIMLLQFYVGIIGFKTWTKSSTTAAVLVVCLPSLIIFGTWAAIVG